MESEIRGKYPHLQVQIMTGKKCARRKGKTKKSTVAKKSAGSGKKRANVRSSTTMDYALKVKNEFSENPDVYSEFAQIMKQAQDPDSDKLELINNVVSLFEGYPNLILEFTSFLPEEYELQIQDDAVVVKVHEDDLKCTTLQPYDCDTSVEPGTWRDLGQTGQTLAANDTVGYIVKVKEAFAKQPTVYKSFIGMLQDYHHGQCNEVDTIQKVVGLFQHYTDLVLGFNEFLPTGYSIHMYEKSGYVVKYRTDAGPMEEMRIAIQVKPGK